jgi:maspardin
VELRRFRQFDRWKFLAKKKYKERTANAAITRSRYKSIYRSASGRTLNPIPESGTDGDGTPGGLPTTSAYRDTIGLSVRKGNDKLVKAGIAQIEEATGKEFLENLNGQSNGGCGSGVSTTTTTSTTSDYSSLGESEPIDVKMNFSSDLSLSEEYRSFRATVPLKKVTVDLDPSKAWKLYDAGPRNVRSPLVCLAPVCGTADVFYRQILALSGRGVRVISTEPPVYWSVTDWCEGFKKLLDHLDVDKVHIFGASLGGYLAQKFAEYTSQYSRVASLILCNAFMDTSIFNLNESAMVFWMLPSMVLKKMVIGNLSSDRRDLQIAQAVDFMTERLDSLAQQDLASRLTINCVNSRVDPFRLRNVKMTLIDVFDESALTNTARDHLYQSYSHAKMAHMKTGGNFPYLSRSDEVNMHILIHLRAFNETRLSASDDTNGLNSDQPIDVAASLDAGVLSPMPYLKELL